MLDRLWHPDLSEDEALQLQEKGIAEVSHLACMAAPARVMHVLPARTLIIAQLAAALPSTGRLQVKKRLVVAPSSYIIQVVDANGLRLVKTIRGDLPASS